MSLSVTNVPFAAGQKQDGRIDGTKVFSTPSHEEIACRAHAIFENTGSVNGQCSVNWHRAEDELKSEAQAACAAQVHGQPTATHKVAVQGAHGAVKHGIAGPVKA
jgi:hypothetical protein